MANDYQTGRHWAETHGGGGQHTTYGGSVNTPTIQAGATAPGRAAIIAGPTFAEATRTQATEVRAHQGGSENGASSIHAIKATQTTPTLQAGATEGQYNGPVGPHTRAEATRGQATQAQATQHPR